MSDFIKEANKFFTEGSVYTISELRSVIKEKKIAWGVPKRLTLSVLIDILVDEGILSRHRVFDEEGIVIKELFIRGNADTSLGLMKIYRNSYFSHHTALSINGLTDQNPKVFYLTYELGSSSASSSVSSGESLSQSDIDTALNLPRRESKRVRFNRRDVVVKVSKFTDLLGVVKEGDIFYTDIERTLLDCAVRPDLCGGVFNVLNIFSDRVGEYSVKKLYEYLSALDYTYPYNQVLGFYLERAGHNGKNLSLFEKPGKVLKFYLDYEMDEKLFNKRWNIYYPEGID